MRTLTTSVDDEGMRRRAPPPGSMSQARDLNAGFSDLWTPMQVEIKGLKSKPELNGRRATVQTLETMVSGIALRALLGGCFSWTLRCYAKQLSKLQGIKATSSCNT